MNIKDLNKIEFWAASFIYGCAVLMLISNGSGGQARIPSEFMNANLNFSYVSNYFIPELFRYSVIYFCFLMLNFLCLPPLYRKVNIGFNASIVLALYLIAGLVISITNTYSKAYELIRYSDIDEFYNQMFFSGFTYSAWLILLICIYTGLKKLLFYLSENQENDIQNRMKLEIVFGLAFCFIGILLWLAAGVDFNVILCWTLVVIASIFMVIYSLYYLIPLSLEKNKPFRYYYGKASLIAILVTLPVCLTAALITINSHMPAVIILFHLGAQLIISIPMSWYIFKKRNETEQQIFRLKKELGKSDASLGFLKSQINPHFLFNALNTLYGTALQENAERTAEGVQRLGDMMRFMLQENVQDKIPLNRDIDYLNNYIALQKLRTSVSVDIQINTQIEERFSALEIAPMLLIPFVENAFKHGISLQSPSHIKVTLQTKGNILYFDVHNSIHLKADGDPEKAQSGIGLANVRQRLELFYPKKHELIIRESAREFFVHLTLNLE